MIHTPDRPEHQARALLRAAASAHTARGHRVFVLPLERPQGDGVGELLSDAAQALLDNGW